MYDSNLIESQFISFVRKYDHAIKMVVCSYYPNGGYQYEALLCDLTTHLWQAYLKRPPGMDDEGEKAWVYVVLSNKASNLVRNDQLHYSRVSYCNTLPDMADVGRPPLVERLYELVEMLDGGDQKILMDYLSGYTIEEIAKDIGRNQLYIFRRMDKIRNKLRELNNKTDK